jgi:chromosome segregation ATPase
MSETETVTKDEAHYTAEMKALREELDREHERRVTAESNAANYKRKFEASNQENDMLRETIHGTEIAKARLEGYIDRARESDPKPEPVMVPLDQHPGLHRNGDFYGSAMTAIETPWYKLKRD